jgi:hypothetical protein
MRDKKMNLEEEEDVTSLEFLQAIYRNPEVPLPVRMRAAGMAIQFEHPKLAVTANVSGDNEFGFRLDQAIQRSGTAPKMIEQQPTTKVIDQPAPAPSKPLIGPVPDKRFRR